MGAAVALYPFAAYAVNHPGLVTNRMNQLSVLQSATPSHDVAWNIWTTVGMLYWKGDPNWRHNFAARPEVFWPVALLMTLGAALSVRNMFARSSSSALLPPVLLLLWIVCGAVPAILSNEGLPHALRSILMLPPIAILAAIGAAEILSVLSPRISSPMLTVAVVSLACALFGETAHTYFFQWARDPWTRLWFDPENALVARQLNSLPAAQAKVLAIQGPREAADLFYLPFISLRFLTRSVTVKQQNESNVHYYTPETFPLPLPPNPQTGDFCAKVKAVMPEAAVVCPFI
jgi:hypothetical protein